MRLRCLTVLLPVLACMCCAGADFDDKLAASLPDVVAVTAGRKITREELLLIMRKRLPSTMVTGKNFYAVAKIALEQELCVMAICKLMAEDGIKPDCEHTEAYFVLLAKLHPVLAPAASPEAIKRAAGLEEWQMQVALQRYMQLRIPDKLVISDERIEDYYRENQKIFERRGDDGEMGYYPLKTVREYIRQQLISVSAAAELKKMTAAALDKMAIKYCPELSE